MTRHVELSTVRLLAKLPTLAAYAYKKSVGQAFLYPDNSLGLVENFLRMTFGNPAENYELDPIVVKALDMLFVLHADHEQKLLDVDGAPGGLVTGQPLCLRVSRHQPRCSGPLHGGANQSVLEMLEAIRADGGERRVLRAEGQEQGGRRQADGLRPSGLQELRPARGKS